MSEASELYTYNLGKKNEEITKLKQERDELAAQVGVMRDALMLYQSAGFGNSTEFRLQMDAYDATVRALSITGPDALREIQARVLEEAAIECDSLDKNGFHYETMDGWDEIPAEACHCAAAIRKIAAAKRNEE